MIEMMTFDMVEQRMVEAVRIWRRSPGRVGPSKGGPYAADAPWELIVADGSDYGGDGVDGVSSSAPIRSAAATRADVAARDEASEWMQYVPERDRRLVVLALGQLASGASRISWHRLRAPLGIKLGAHGLRKRYGRAISGIAEQINRRKCEGRDGQGL